MNNAAIAHECPTYFIDEDEHVIRNMIEINCSAQLEMCRIMIPIMKKHGRGLILNIGSLLGSIPTGLQVTYSATKAFLKTFSLGLSMELAQDNILVQHVNTCYVVSDMSKIKRSSWMVPTPKDYVKSVISQVGCGKSITPYPSHKLITFLSRCLPTWILMAFIFSHMKKHHLKAQKRLLDAQKSKNDDAITK